MLAVVGAHASNGGKNTWRRSGWVTSGVQSGGSSVAKASETASTFSQCSSCVEGADAAQEGDRIGLGRGHVHDNGISGGGGELMPLAGVLEDLPSAYDGVGRQRQTK